MPGTGTSVVICPDGRVIPVASGVYVHKRSPGTGLSDPVDEVSLARASFYEPRSDATLVHLAPGAELSSIVRNYLDGLPDRVRDHLVVVPTPTLTEGLDPAAVRALEELTDLYHLPIEVPVALDLRQSPRAVPIDGHGQGAPWPQATAVRLLDRPQAAARVALGAALAIAQNSEPPPSMRRLEQVLTMAVETEDDFSVPPETSLAAAAAAAEVAAVVAYLGRYGVPPGLDVDAVGRSTLPRAAVADTVAAFLALADGVTTDVETLVEELREAPGSAVLVRSHTGGATRTAWLMSGDADAPGLWWVEPQTDGSLLPVAFDPDSDDGRVAALRAAGTRVTRVDRAGLPVGRNLPVVPWAEVRGELEERLAVVLPPGRGVGDALEDCVDRLEAVRRGWFGGAVVVDDAGLGTGRVQDRLAAALGGDWRPVGDSLGPVVGRLRELGDGAVAFVLVAPPVGPRHGIVVAAWRGGVFVVETQNVVGERVWDVVDGVGNVVAPAWLPGLLGARVIVAGPDGVAVPFAVGGVGSAVTGATTVNALVDPAPGLRYLGSSDEGEFSNVLFGVPAGAMLSDQIAEGPHGAQVTLEMRRAYTDRDQSAFWQNRPAEPATVRTSVALAEFVAPVSSSFPNEPGAAREAIHRVREQVAEAFSRAHFSELRQPLSDVLTPEMGWLIHPDWQNVQIGQRLVGGWTGILPQYNHDVPFAGAAKFLEFVAENTWRTKSNDHPHWAKEHLNDGLNLGLRVAADYVYSETGRRVPFRELLDRPHAETETIRGLIALYYVTFAMGSIAEWIEYNPDRHRRGTLKNDAAVLLRNDKRLVFKALPAGVREFFAAQGAAITHQFKSAFRARFGLPLGIPDSYLTQGWTIEEHSEIRDALGQPRVHEDSEETIDVITIVPINMRMPLPRLVIEVRAYKAREVDVHTVQAYTEEIVHQEREAYYHAERLMAAASSGEGIGDHFALAHDDSPSGVPGMALSNLPASDSEQSDADESASVISFSPDSYGEPDLAASMAEVRRELEDRLAEVLPPGRDVGDALEDCLDRLEAVRRGWFGGPVAVDDAGLGTGRLQDRLAAALGGDWRPVGDSLDPLVTRLRGLGDGAAAFVLVAPPVGPRHGIVLAARRGGVFAVETQNPVGERVWDAVDGAGRPVAPPWMPGLLGARVIVAGPDGVAVPFADGEAGAAVTGATTVNALVDPAPGLRYLGSADEGEFSNILIGVAPGTRPQVQIAMGPYGTQLTLELRHVYSNRERTSFWQIRPRTPMTDQVYAPLAEFVAPVSSSLPGERGEDRRQIHWVRMQVARAFRLAHDSGTPQLLSELLTPEMGWQMHPARQNVQVGRRLIGGWEGILPQYNHDVPFAGVAKFLEFVAENTWRTKTNGHPHWAKEHLNDGLGVGLQVAADYVKWRTGRQVPLQELLDRPHVETETIRGVIALYYETFAMGSMNEFHSRNPDRTRRGTLKNDAAVLVRNDKRLIYQELPEGIKLFFAAQSADILSQFKVAFHAQFGLPAEYLTRDWDIAEHPDVIGGLGQLAEVDPNIDRLRELNGEDFEDVDAEQVDTMTIVPINRRMPLPRVVIEVRAYKVREAPARAVQTYTEELVAQEIEAYSHAERLTAAASGGQDVGDHFTSGYFDSTFGVDPSILAASGFERSYPDAAYPGSDTAAPYDLEAGIGVPDQSAPPVLYTTYGAGLSILPTSASEGSYPDAAYPESGTAALYDLEAGIGVPDQSAYMDPGAFPDLRMPFSPDSYWELAQPAFPEAPFSPDSYGMPDLPVMDNFPSSDGTAEPAGRETSRGAGRRGRGRRAPADVDVVRASGERPAAVASLVGSAEIDELRPTVLPRTANTTAYDVVEGASTERGLPRMVIDSHVAFQAEERDASVTGGVSEVDLSRVDLPRVSLSRVEGPVAYDYRVLETADGRRVRDFTVRVHLGPQDATARAAESEVRERVAKAVDDAFNQQFRIGADQLHVNVEFVAEPELAHATVGLFGEEAVATTQTAWLVTDSDLRYAHEVGHYLGLPDEYVDPLGDERRLLLSRDRSSAVFGDNSLMATTKAADRPQLQPRHIERIAATVASEVSPHTTDPSLPIPPRDPDEMVGSRPGRSVGRNVLAVSMAEVRRGLEEGLAGVLPPGRGVGDALEDCVDRLEAVRRGWFGGAVVVDDAGLGTGRVQDRLAAALGGDWRPVGDSFDPLVTRLRGLGDGAAAFVLVAPPVGPRHGIVLTVRQGGVFAVETQNPVGERVWDAVDGAGRPVAPPWMPGLLGARVIVAGPDGVAVPFADGEAGAAVTGATTANALVDPAPGLRYLGSADEGEFSNILIGVAPGTRPHTLIAMGPNGIQLTLETRDVYTNRDQTAFWQSKPDRPETEPFTVGLAEFVAPVSSSFPAEPGEDRQEIHWVRRQVAQAFRVAHRADPWLTLSQLLTQDWQIQPGWDQVEVGPRLRGGWEGVLPQYNHDVPFAGVAKFLEFVAANTWRTKADGHPHWAKEHLNDGLGVGLQVAADYVKWRTGRQVPLQELLDRPHVETETIRGVIALYYETFAMGAMLEFHWRNPDQAQRGTLKNDAAALVRNDKRLIYQELPEGIQAFFAAHRAEILSHFKAAFQAQFGLPVDYLTQVWRIEGHSDVIGGLGWFADVEFTNLSAAQVDMMTIVPINRRMQLPRVVIEVRAYKVRAAPARHVETYTEELVEQEIEAYYHAERLTAAAAGGQGVGDHFTSSYFDSTFGVGPSILPASASEGPYLDASAPGPGVAALGDLEARMRVLSIADPTDPPAFPESSMPFSPDSYGVPETLFSPDSYAFSETLFSSDSYGVPDITVTPVMDNFPSSDGTAEPAAREASRGAGRRGRGRRAPEDSDVVRTSGERPAAVGSLVESAEIDELRLTVLPRTANTIAYDVVEGAATERGLPRMVIDSHVAFQAEERDASVTGDLSEVDLSRVDLPRVSLSRVEGPVAYDYRVLETADGRRVRDFTVRVHLGPQDAAARAAESEVRERVAKAVDDAFNQQFRIGADQLHVNVEFVAEPELAHATVGLFGEEAVDTSQTAWSVTDSDLRYAHEIGHYLGLPDEYVDPVGDERRLLLSKDRSSAVFGDNSLMATTKPADRPQLQPRHIERIAATAASEVSPHTPDPSLPTAPRDPDETVGTRPAPPKDKGKGKAQEGGGEAPADRTQADVPADASRPATAPAGPATTGIGDPGDQARVVTWGWESVAAESALSAPVQQALTVNGLRGLADQSGMPFFAKVAASAGYQGDQELGYLDADSVRTMVQAYADKLREARDWSSFGVPEPGPASIQQIDDWIAGGLDPDQVPGVLTEGLPASSAATEVLLRLTAPALARQIQLIRADGTAEWYKPSDVAMVEHPVITLVESASAVLATVPLETVPAVLAADEGSLISPVVSTGLPVGLPADELAFNDLASFLAAVSGDASVTLPTDLSDRLRAATLREEAGLVAGPGLEGVLTAVREAVAKNAKPLLPADPPKWQRVPAGQGYPELTTDQANYLADGGRSAVWNPAAPSGFFEALLQAAEHDQYRLRGLSDWPAAELRVMFGALLRADLAAAGDAWPLLGATSQEFSSSRDELLEWVTDLSTPGVPAPTDTPKWLAPAVAQLFGVNVLLVEPDVRLGGAMIDPDWPQLVLVTSADGRVMATTPADPAEAGTVRRLESVDIPAVPSDRPGAEQAGGSEAEPGRSVEVPETSAAAGSAGKSPSTGSVEEPSAALGRPKPASVKVPAAGELIDIDPSAYPMGVPKEGLPYLDQLTAQLHDALRGEKVTLGEDEWLKLRQRLLANYRKITSPSGYLERQGHLDLRFRLELGEARAAGDPKALPEPPVPGKPAEDAKGKESPIRGVGAIQMTVATGGDSGSRTGQTSATRAGIGINGSPPVLSFMTVRAGPRFTATMNKVDRSTGYFTTAETAHVDDTRSELVLAKVETKWSFSIGKSVKGQGYRWSAPTPVVVTGVKQPLLLWMPLQYVGQPSADQVRAIAPEAPQPDATPQEIETFKKRSTRFEQNRERIPRHFFAAGLGGLSDLYADGVGLLERAGLPVESDMLLQQVARALWNLDTHLDTAVNDPRGYVIPLADEVGRDIGRLVARGRRKGTPLPIGTPSNQAHLEKVRTAISTHTSGFNLTNESGLGIEAAFDLVKAPMITAGPEARATFTATNSDGVSASRNGLNVLVSRYTGYTVAFHLKFDFDLELTVLNDRKKSFKSPRPTPGETLLRIPEKDAFDYSFPVDRAALKEDVTSAKGVPFVEDAVRDSRAENKVSEARLPAYLLRGRGAGHALVEVDTALPGKLYEAVSEELRKRGYVSNDLDLPFAKQLKTVGRSVLLPDILRSESGAAVQSRQRNDRALRLFLSSDSLDSHYDQAHQDGMFLTLRRQNRYGQEKIIRVTVVATQELTEEIDPKNKSSVYIKDLTDDYSTVNLAMGLDAAGQSAGGSTSINFGLGGYARVAKGFLGRFGLGIGYTRSVGAVESNSIVTNMPQLQESTAKAHELELPSEYKIKLEFEDDKEESWSSDAIGATATVHLVEDFNVAPTTTPMRGRAPQNTPPAVLENAVVLHLDSTGVLAAARKVLRGFTKPGREADEPTSRFTSNVTLHAHLKEMMADRYTTDSFFRPGFFRHQLGSLGIKAEVGRSTFVGVTKDNFTLGLIKLSLTQSSQNATRSHKGVLNGEFTFGGTTAAPSGEAADQGGAGGGVVGHGIEGPGATGGSAAAPTSSEAANYGGAAGPALSYTRAYTKKRGARQTGGKEYLELNFARAYVFDAPAGFTVQAVREKHGKLMLNKGEISEPEKVPDGFLRYALSEPDALKEFAAGRVELPENQLADVFERWISQKTEFSIKALVGALAQWHSSVADSGVVDTYRNERESWARKLAEKHRNDTGRIYDPADLKLFAETFPEIPLTPVSADEDLPNAARSTYLPPYFLEGAPRAIGHAGIHSLTYQDPSFPGETFTAYDLVRREIDKVVPGLLGRERADWQNARVWRGSFFGDSGKSQIGRVQGGLDGLQAMLAGGRDQPLIEDMLGDDPFRFSIVNPMGWLLSDVVDVKISVKWRDGEPEPIDLVPESGLENYFHAYQLDSTGKGRDSIYSATLKGNFAPTYSSKGTTVGGAVQWVGGQRRSNNQHVERIEEATAYSWNKAYHYRRPITITIEVNRQMMPGRVVNNILAKIRRPLPRKEPASYPGELIVKLPQGLVESPPVQGPAPMPTMHPLPKLPADMAVISFRIENALPVAEELLRKTFGEGTTKKIFGPGLATSVFGEEADNYRPSLSLSTLLSPHHLGNHLPKMLAGQRHRLTPTLLEPGHSRVRAEFHIWGELHELRVVRMIDEGMGTGRYVKDISNNSVNVSLDKPDAAASLEVGQSGTVNDRQLGSEQVSDKMSGSTPFSRQAPLGSSADANLAQRGEQHSKQLGPSYLVEVKGRFFLEMTPYKQGLFSSENKKRGKVVRSAPLFGEGYIQAFGEQIEEMQRQLHEFRTAPPAKDPTPWPAAEGAPREVDLDRSLFEAAKNGGGDAPGQVARSLRQPQEKQPTLILSTHVGQRAYLTYKAVSEWEFDLRYPGAAADSDAARAANQERLTTLDGLTPKAETPAGVRELEGLVDEAIARAGALSASPPSTLLRALGGNPVYQAQEIAFRLNTHVEVRQAGYRWRESASPGDPETAIDRISPDGRITPVNYPGVDAPAGPVGEPQASRSGRAPAAAPALPPLADSPVPPPVPAPQGSRWDGNTLVIGTWGGPSFNELTQVGHWSTENPPGILIAVNPTRDKGGQLVLDQLRTALQRTARIGVIPTVLFWNTPPGLLEELRADYVFSTLQRRVVNLDDSTWQRSGPDGRLAGRYDVITDALAAQKSAGGPPTGEISARLAARKLPPALAGWLSENNWQDRETYLRAHFQELLAPEVQAVLGRNADGTMTGLPAGEDGNLAGATQVILDLVRANGGPAGEDAPRLAPAADIPSHKFEPPVALEGPLRETFAFDYLLPRPKPKPSTVRTERASWDDLLLRLFSMGKLTGPQMVALANGVAEGSRGVANATIFAAIAAVMRMPQKVAELPTHDNSEFGRLADAVANCDVLPADRVSWVARFDAFHDQVAGGQPGHAALLHVLLEKLTNC